MKKSQYIILGLIALLIVGVGVFTSREDSVPEVVGAGVILPFQGGTGTSSKPILGDVLVGQGDGLYAPQATSTLGLGGGGGGGEANTGSSLGTGLNIFDSKSGVDLRFNTIAAGTNVTLSTSTQDNTIVISSSGGGGGGGSGSVGTSTPDVDTQVTFFTSNSATPALIGGEAAFTYDDSINLLTVDNLSTTTIDSDLATLIFTGDPLTSNLLGGIEFQADTSNTKQTIRWYGDEGNIMGYNTFHEHSADAPHWSVEVPQSKGGSPNSVLTVDAWCDGSTDDTCGVDVTTGANFYVTSGKSRFGNTVFTDAGVKLGIGTATPETLLTVGRDSNIPQISLVQTDVSINSTADQWLGEITWRGNDKFAGEDGVGAQLHCLAAGFWNGTSNDYPTDCYFLTTPDGSGALATSTKWDSDGTFEIINGIVVNTGATLTVTDLTSALIVTNASGVMAEYAGTSCTNQFIQSLSALGVATCVDVDLATDITGTLPVGNGGTGVTSLDDILGTANEITVGAGANTIIGGDATLSLPSSVFLGTSGQLGRDADNLMDLTTDNEIMFRTNATDDRLIIKSDGRVGIASSTPMSILGVGGTTTTETLNVDDPDHTGTSTIYIYSDTAGFGGEIILEDDDGAGCTSITVLNGTISGITVTCPADPESG